METAAEALASHQSSIEIAASPEVVYALGRRRRRGRRATAVLLGVLVVVIASSTAYAQSPEQVTPPEVVFGHDRGIYDQPFDLVLSPKAGEADIYYTVDGSYPTTTSTKYVSPIRVGETTLVRAIGVNSAGTSETSSYTYAFVHDVLAMSEVQTYLASYPEIEAQLATSLNSLPVLFFDDHDLIDPVSRNRVRTTFEYVDTQAGLSVGKEAIYGVFGNDSRRLPKNNYRVFFNAETGGDLRAPIFAGHGDGYPTVQQFDKLDLRSSHESYALADGVPTSTYLASAWINWAARNMGSLNPAARFVHVFRNGTYWGVYTLRETFDNNMAAEYFGGATEDYVFINSSAGKTQREGNVEDYEVARRYGIDNGYEAFRERYGVPTGVIDSAMTDVGGTQATIRTIGNSASGYYTMWTDADHTLSSMSAPLSLASGVLAIGGFGSDPAFKRDFADRLQCALDLGGSLNRTTSAAKVDELAAEFRRGIHAEMARWGVRTRSVAGWEANVARMRNEWVPAVEADALARSRRDDKYPELDPVAVMVDDSRVMTLSATQTGAIYYTLDGSDPQIDGQPNPSALLYQGPVQLLSSQVEPRARLFDSSRSAANGGFEQWSASCPRRAIVTGGYEGLIISEIMYHPADHVTDGEFIEIFNAGSEPVSLDNLRLQGGIRAIDFADRVLLPPGEVFVVAEDSASFTATYGFPPDATYLGSLSNGGELVELATEHGMVLDSVSYDDGAGWWQSADGDGASLIRRSHEPGASSEAWALGPDGGTPGVATIAAFVLGDASCDGRVDALDATVVLEDLVELPLLRPTVSCGSSATHVELDTAACDTDADGDCDLRDAMALAQCFTSDEFQACIG